MRHAWTFSDESVMVKHLAPSSERLELQLWSVRGSEPEPAALDFKRLDGDTEDESE